MNIMYVSVTERTREIGLRMSIGAKGMDILAQFLIESILISVTGGLIGVLFGVGAALIVNVVAHFPIYIQPWSVLLSFVVCTVTGVFFGWYPAKKAAQLDPIEAIRYELSLIHILPCLTTARSIKLSYVQMIIPVGAALLIWMGGVSPAWIILAAIAGGLVYGLNKKG